MKKFTFLLMSLLVVCSYGQVSINENFDSGTPAGWTDSYANTTSQVCSGQSERDNIYSGSATGDMTSPNQVAASNGTDITFSIDYKVVDWSAATVPTADGWGTADLQYSIDDGANWITAGTIDDSNDSNSNVCTTFGVTILGASVPSGSDLRFRVLNTWAAGDYYFYIDNFTATQVASLPPNCDSSLTSATTDFPIDGTLSWSVATGIPTGYKISVGSTMGGTDIANNVDVGLTTSYVPTGLAYSTTYYVTITPYNANGDATGCTEESFAVEAAPPTGSVCTDPIDASVLPYTAIGATTIGFGDDYDGSAGSSGCGSTSPYLSGEDIVYAHTASADGSIDVNLTNITDTYTGVFIYNDCADIGTTCAAGDVNGFSTADLSITNFPVTNGSTYYIVISTWTAPDTTTFDLSITSGATCFDVSGLTLDSVTTDSATISWTAAGSETAWEIAVQDDGTGTPGAADGSGTDTTTNPHTENGLMPDSDYEVYVRAECTAGTDFGGWIGPLDFTTPALCPDVSAIVIDSFTNDEVNVSWSNGGTETDWEVAVQIDGTGTPSGSGAATSTNPYNESGLDGDTAYEVYVRADCTGLGNGYSEWVGPVDFTTLCDELVPDYTADMSTHLPDACWDDAGSGEVIDGPGGLGFSDWRSGTSYAFGSSNAINLYDDDDREWLLSPTFDLSTGGPYQLEVNVAVTDWNNGASDDTMGSDDEVQLLISTDGGTVWNNLTTWNAANEPAFTGTEYIEDLTAYSGSVQFAIWASDGTVNDSEDYDFHVGKFSVVDIPGGATVDFCNLQFPDTGSVAEGGSFTAFARIFEDTRTQPAGADPGIEAWIGVSSIDATSTSDFTSPNWTWIPATFNSQFGNDDEYSAEIASALTPGSYFYASRFRVDGGIFAYGGITPGGSGGNFWDGSSFVSGQLNVVPATSATLNINGCGDSDSYSGAYDASTQGIVWVELVYDGGCSEVTVDTEGTVITGDDTEIGLYDANGTLIGSNDDGGTGALSLFTANALPAGTYYIAAGGYNVSYGSSFNVTTNASTETGTININASTPNSVDYCNLQFPDTASTTPGNNANVFAQVFESGVTEAAGQGAGIEAWIGYSATDATTTADFETVDWTWEVASYNADAFNNDEYTAAIGASLLPGTYYYVSRFRVDGGAFAYGGIVSGGSGGDFWDGATYVSGILTVNPSPEPTNHVSTFSAVADSDSQITLTWDDNDGAEAADGFLIVGKTGAASFFTPVDGTEPADDTDWSDDEFEVKVAPGVQTYVVTGLAALTLYEFEIYPYTNAGSIIDFKTDGTVPSSSATTLADPCLSVINTFPFTEGFEGTEFPPQCWDSFRGTNGLGTGFDWTRTTTTVNTGSGAATVRYENVDGGNAQDWLVTPAMDLSGISNPELSFFSRESFGSNFGTIYTIRVSTTDTAISSFAIVDTFDEDDFGTSYTEFTVDLSAYTSNTNVYIAFVSENDDGDTWFLDDVTVDGDASTVYTYNGSWSPSDPNGVATAGDNIVIASGDATINTNTTCNTMTVNPGAGLTVDTGVTLTVSNGMTMESTSTSYSSLILDGSVAGTMNYERHVNINGSGTTGSNDLISAPLTGQAFNLFEDANPNIFSGSGPTADLRLFGPFDKTTGAYVTYDQSNTATLDAGIGYRAASDDNDTFTFTGTANSGTVPATVVNFGPSFVEWNLIGNPYPSYLNVQDFLNNAANGALFDPANVAIYGYDGSASNGWTVLNLANTSTSTSMTPGQGFFVAAQTSGNMEFTPSMRRTGKL